MQSVSSRIWTRVAVSISYGDNDYTTGTSKHYDDETSVMQELWGMRITLSLPMLSGPV